MSKAHPPELRKFMDKKLSIKVNGGKLYQATDDAYLWLINFRPKSWRHASRIWSIHELGHWWCYRVPKGKFQTTFITWPRPGDLRFLTTRWHVWNWNKKDSSSHTMGMCVIRGNSVLMIEALERIWNQKATPVMVFENSSCSWKRFFSFTSCRKSLINAFDQKLHMILCYFLWNFMVFALEWCQKWPVENHRLVRQIRIHITIRLF